MKRRDTIIIAVLVNAALLMILFATATRSDQSKELSKKSTKIAETKVEELARHSKEYPISDDLLNSFVTSVPTLRENEVPEGNMFFEDTALAFTSSVPTAETITPPAVDSKIATPKIEEQFAFVTVKKGDFLEKIAKSNNTTIAAIMKSNNLSSTQLKIGQVLKIPLSEQNKSHSKSSSLPESSQEEYYIVKEGDNPWIIANRNKINLEELLRINGLDEQKAKRLRPGYKLKIR